MTDYRPDNLDRRITHNYSDGLEVKCYKCGWEGHIDYCLMSENEESAYCPNCEEEI